MTSLFRALLLWGAFLWIILHAPGDSLWYDETVNAYLATSDWQTIIDWTSEIDNQLPLHFVLLKLWQQVLGSSEFSLRLFSHFSAWLAIAGFVALGRSMLCHEQSAWLGAIALALSGGFLYAAMEVRTYSLALALLVWAAVFLHKMLKQRQERLGLSSILALLLLLLAYTHYTAWVMVGGFVLIVGISPLFYRDFNWRAVGIAFVPPLAAILLWLVWLGGRDINAGTAFAGTISVKRAFDTYIAFGLFGQKIFDDSAQSVAQNIALVGSGLIVLVAVFYKQRLALLWTLTLLVFPLMAMVAAVTQIEGKLSGRHTWAMWIGAALLFALVLDTLQAYRWGRMLLPMLLAMLVGGALSLAHHDLPEEYHGDFRGAFAIIEREANPDDLLILRDGTLFTAAEYYNSSIDYVGLPQDPLTDVNHRIQIHEALDILSGVDFLSRPRVWVLAWQADTMDPTALGLVIPEYYSQGRRHVWLEEGQRGVQLYSYTLQERNQPLLDHLATLPGVVQVASEGPSLLGIDLYHHRIAAETCATIAHIWWWRGEVDYPDTLVSLRLLDEDNQRIVQQDLPPAGPYFGQALWTPFIPIVGRMELRYPCEVLLNDVRLEMVVYDAFGAQSPQPINLESPTSATE